MKKKTTIFNILNWLKDAGLKAFAVFLLLAAGFYAYAQIEWPTADPNPVSGVVGMYVGTSTGGGTGTDGNVGGYDAANALCEGAFSGSHICSTAEMVNSYNHKTPQSPINTASGIVWINSAAPGNIFPAINDCRGWTNNGLTPYYGTVWNFGLGGAAIQPCAVVMGFACCK